MIRCLVLLALLLPAGCPRFGYHPHPLKAYTPATCAPQPGHPAPCAPFASIELEPSTSDETFVGVSLSGGGFRAANFAAAALLALKGKVDLRDMHAISANSGGAITAALAALDGYRDPWRILGTIDFFDEPQLKDRLRTNLQYWYVMSWLSPFNALAALLTTYNRTDIMYYAFDDYLFGRATYRDIAELRRNDPQRRPQLLINATDKDELEAYPSTHRASGPSRRFVFAQETLRDHVGADLGAVPVSVAVTASSAVPGLYNTATLKTPKTHPATGQHQYLHLMDGMLTDDLAAGTLLDVLRSHVERREPGRPWWGGCVLIVVDASPAFYNRWRYEDETREFYKDYLIDRNMADAAAYILLSQRHERLKELGFPEQDIKHNADLFATTTIEDRRHGKHITCRVWHIALRHIDVDRPDPAPRTQMEREAAKRCEMYRRRANVRTGGAFSFGHRLTWIPTELDITTCQQEDLFIAANRLVEFGWNAGAQGWFP